MILLKSQPPAVHGWLTFFAASMLIWYLFNGFKISERGEIPMKWITRDMDLYLQAKEYVDTAVIPLIPVTWENDVKTTVAMGEFITILTNEMERQFKGRIILFPPFTYTALESVESRIERLTTWTSELSEKGMKYFFFVSSDSIWKQQEENLETGSLIWLPSLPLEYVEEKYKQAMLQDQMKQLITIFMSIWQKNND